MHHQYLSAGIVLAIVLVAGCTASQGGTPGGTDAGPVVTGNVLTEDQALQSLDSELADLPDQDIENELAGEALLQQ